MKKIVSGVMVVLLAATFAASAKADVQPISEQEMSAVKGQIPNGQVCSDTDSGTQCAKPCAWDEELSVYVRVNAVQSKKCKESWNPWAETDCAKRVRCGQARSSAGISEEAAITFCAGTGGLLGGNLTSHDVFKLGGCTS